MISQCLRLMNLNLEKFLRILQFFEITKNVSSEESIISCIIPHTVALHRYLSKTVNNDRWSTNNPKWTPCNALRKRMLGSDRLSSTRGLNIWKTKTMSWVHYPRFKLFMDHERSIKRKRGYWKIVQAHLFGAYGVNEKVLHLQIWET